MASRLELQTKLEEILGNGNVYFQPPSTLNMNYPAIVYSIDDVDSMYADDSTYKNIKAYKIIAIDTKKDFEIFDKLLQFKYCNFVSAYSTNNLNHYVFKIYY